MICRKCNVDKPESDFYKENLKSGKIRVKRICKECDKDRLHKDYRRKFPEIPKVPKIIDGNIVCSTCGISKPTSEYNRHKRKGLINHGEWEFLTKCKECTKKIIDIYYSKEENREKKRTQTRLWKRKQRTTPEGWCKGIIHNVIFRARQDNVPCEITWKDIFDVYPKDGLCPVLHIPLVIGAGKGKCSSSSPSIDKFIQEKGYVKGNIAIISYRANRMKSDATIAEILMLADWAKNQQSKLNNFAGYDQIDENNSLDTVTLYN